jgi:hypothetical protein
MNEDGKSTSWTWVIVAALAILGIVALAYAYDVVRAWNAYDACVAGGTHEVLCLHGPSSRR